MYKFVRILFQMKLQLSFLFCMYLSLVFSASSIKNSGHWSVAEFQPTDSLKFTIFPNPLKNKILNIESASQAIKHIEIYNVFGEKKYIMDTYEDRIFLDELNTGIYIFLLEQEGQKGLKRLVVP